MKFTVTKKSKGFISIMTLILAISMMSFSSISVNAENSYSNLTELANEYIVKTQSGDELVPISTYTGIPDFVEKAHEFFPSITDVDLARFIYTYTGRGSSENIPDSNILRCISSPEVVVQSEYAVVTPDGNSMRVTQQQAIQGITKANDNAITIHNNSIVSPCTSNSWTSDDNYIKILTTYEYLKTSGNYKYYVITAKANWLKQPTFRLRDVLCVGTSAVFVDSYNDYAYYLQQYRCLSNDLTSHFSQQHNNKVWASTGNNDDIQLLYPSLNGAGVRVDLKTFVCAKPGVDAHIKQMIKMESYVEFCVKCEKGKSCNIQSAYGHARISGNLDFSVSTDKSISISFSPSLTTTQYSIRPITIDA